MKSSNLAVSQTESSFFSDREVETIYELTEEITGTCQEGRFRKSILVNNVRRRMDHHGISDLKEYIRFAKSEKSEMNHLVSALTIHTTSWFREPKQYEILEKRISESISTYRARPLRVLCAACSTGEEVYSFALVLERLREFYNGFEYKIDGFDIDPVSVKTGEKAVYRMESGYDDISDPHKRFLLVGNGKTEGFFTLTKAIRDRCKFFVKSLKDRGVDHDDVYDIVICRNVLIYFKSEEASGIVKNLLAQMDESGMFITGTSEAVIAAGLGLTNLGASCFVHKGKEKLAGNGKRNKCLVVEDSAIDRAIMKRQFEKYGLDVEAVESAEDATAYLNNHKVDIITLDLQLPKQNGFDWLKYQRQHGLKTPVVIISGALPHEAQKVLDALGTGAQDYFNKNELRKNAREIVERLEAIVHHNVVSGGKGQTGVISARKADKKRPDLILIGASTGGTEALVQLLPNMPVNSPPILVVQHIAQQFSPAFYERLAQTSKLKMVKPADHMLLEPGHLYMSDGDYHIGVAEAGGVFRLRIGTSMTYGVHRPSVDYLFKSACRVHGNITAVLLTGMGKDGARGLLELFKKGALTYCQDEASCVVFGMPKEAIQLGAARVVGNLNDIRKGLLSNL
jgi:two-component system, chemotaxis family, protein-glutamate methylesterase/glutaminase